MRGDRQGNEGIADVAMGCGWVRGTYRAKGEGRRDIVLMEEYLRHLQQKASVWMQERELEDHSSPTNQDKEAKNLENNSNPDTIDPLSASPERQSPPSSTRLLRLAEPPLPLRPCYRLHSAILRAQPVTETMRAKLRSFLMEESAKQWLQRQTYVLGCTLADLFFAHGGTVSVTDFQTLFLACLILASKLNEGKFPTISFQTFSREQLMAFEKRVALQLSFNLTPRTYYHHAERIAFLWDAFTEQEGEFTNKFLPGAGGSRPLRSYYEQLDCSFMVLRTLDYDIEDLVVNLFYIHARILNQTTPDPSTLTNQQFNHAFYPTHHDAFRDFFQLFMQGYSTRTFKLSPQVGEYLRPFLGARSSQQEGAWIGVVQAVQDMLSWEKFQTVPQGNYQLAKTVIKRNSNRGQQL